VATAIIAGLVLGTAMPSDVEDPLASSPLVASPDSTVVSGAAVSILRGPFGFTDDPNTQGGGLRVHAISVRANLHPDLARIEQTYTIVNSGSPLKTQLGIVQTDPSYATGEVIHTPSPIGAVAYLNGGLLDSNAVNITKNNSPRDTKGGYRVGLQATIPNGKSRLTVVTVIQTVATSSDENMKKPVGSGWSRLALQFNHYAWDWSFTPDGNEPKVTISLHTSKQVGLERLHAEEWTPALSDGSSLWFENAKRLIVRYDSPTSAKRARTYDELEAEARVLLTIPPNGHVIIPASATPVFKPNRTVVIPPVDRARAHRALIIPVIGMALLLLCALVVRRYNQHTY